MLVSELLEGFGERHHEHEWRAGVQAEQTYALVTQSGQVIRPGLTAKAAQALQARPDLIKKYGRLFIKKSAH